MWEEGVTEWYQSMTTLSLGCVCLLCIHVNCIYVPHAYVLCAFCVCMMIVFGFYSLCAIYDTIEWYQSMVQLSNWMGGVLIMRLCWLHVCVVCLWSICAC